MQSGMHKGHRSPKEGFGARMCYFYVKYDVIVTTMGFGKVMVGHYKRTPPPLATYDGSHFVCAWYVVYPRAHLPLLRIETISWSKKVRKPFFSVSKHF